MEIEEASAKVRTKGVADDDEDYAVADLRRTDSSPHGARRAGAVFAPARRVTRPEALNGYSEGRLLEDALRDAHFRALPRGLKSG